LKIAVPALVICAVPTMWRSSQCAAVASQKFTTPGVTGVVPAATVAVSVTTVPDATVVTALLPLVIVSVVLVAVAVCANAAPPHPSRHAKAQTHAHACAARVRPPAKRTFGSSLGKSRKYII
jgi:hypothetical protein